MGSNKDFVVDMHYADWVWKHIRGASRVYWPDDERLTYQTKINSIKTKKWYRNGTWDREEWQDWAEQGDPGVPDFIGTPQLDFMKDKVKSVYLAGVTYTIIGSWYTFEIKEDEDAPAVFDPIRLPVTREMVPEAKEWARDRGGEFIREKGVEFQERFATALGGDEARLAASDLNDVHVRIPDVESEQEAKEIFREATQMAEQAVRKVM